MTKRLLGAIIILMIPWTVTGCWDYHELDKDAMVSLVGYDIDKHRRSEITVSIELSPGNTSGNQGGQSGSSSSAGHRMDVFAHALGDSFSEALHNLSDSVPNHLNFLHHTALVYGEEMTKSPLFLEHIDRMTRGGVARRQALMFLAAGRAQDVIQASHTIPMEIGKALARLAEESKDQQLSLAMTLNEFMYDLTTVGIQPALPRIELARASMGAQASEQTGKSLRLIGCGAFRDGLFVGWLNGEATRGLVWLRGLPGSPTISFVQNGQRLAVMTAGLSTDIIALRARPGSTSPPTYLIRVHWQGSLAQYTRRRPPDVSELPSIQQALAGQITATLIKAITRAQNLQADVFGFGNALYCTDPKRYQAYAKNGWDTTVFPHVRYRIEVVPTIMDTGMTSVPPKSRS